jgi:hypothetical protein
MVIGAPPRTSTSSPIRSPTTCSGWPRAASLGARAAGEGDAWPQNLLLDALRRSAVASLDTDVGGMTCTDARPGAAPYADLRARALVIEVAGLTVSIAGRDDLSR